MLIGLVAVVLAVGAAVVKPWEGGDPAPIRPAPSVAAVRPTPAPSDPRPVPLRPPAMVFADTLLAAAVPRAERGVRVFSDAPGPDADGDDAEAGGSLIETWTPASVGGAVQPVVLTSTTPVRALGITTVAGDTPLAVRVWRDSGVEGWRWLDVPSIASDRPAADLLFAPPRLGGIAIPSWPAGRYRLDLLGGTEIDRIDVELRAPAALAGSSPDLDHSPSRRFGHDDSPRAVEGLPRAGAYVLASGVHRPLSAHPGRLLTEAEAWLDPDRRVARHVLPGAIALGVTLPPDATAISGLVRRLAPDPVFEGPTGRVVDREGDGPAIEFVRGGVRAWAPGVYAIEVAWDDGDGRHEATWHIELLPGDAAGSRPLLVAARRYAPEAGREALVVGRPRRLGMEAGSEAVVTFPLAGDVGCERSRMDETPVALGIGLPDGARLDGAEALRERTSGGNAAVGLRIVPQAMPGLALIAPRDAERFRPGIYQFRLVIDGRGRSDDLVRRLRMCLGPPPFEGRAETGAAMPGGRDG